MLEPAQTKANPSPSRAGRRAGELAPEVACVPEQGTHGARDFRAKVSGQGVWVKFVPDGYPFERAVGKFHSHFDEGIGIWLVAALG